MRPNKIARLYFLLLIFVAVSCKQPIELKESFSFQSDTRPNMHWVEAFTKTMNLALADQAIKTGKDSVLQFKSEGQANKLPSYRDIIFFPVLSATQLEELSNKGFGRYTKNEYLAQIGAIDFENNFVFLVAHPEPSLSGLGASSSTYAQYFDELQLMGVGNGKISLKLNSERLGNATGGLAALMQKWKSTVYVIEKNGCDTVLIEMYEDEFPFSLIPADDSVKR